MIDTTPTANGSVYVLTEQERGAIQVLNGVIVNAKAKLNDAREELAAAQHAFAGGLGMLATAHGVGGGQLTPDFTAIVKQEAQ